MMFGKCWAEKSNSVFQLTGRRLQDALAWSRQVLRGLFEFHLASEVMKKLCALIWKMPLKTNSEWGA